MLFSGKKRQTSVTTDRAITRTSKKDPFKSSNQIKHELSLSICTSTVRRRLLEAGLKGRRPRKVPKLTPRHMKNRLQFAKHHIEWPTKKWHNILWSDESKVMMIDCNASQTFVRRPNNAAFCSRYTSTNVKFGGGSIMIWACVSWYGVGPIFWIKEKMTADVYVNIMQNTMLPFAEEEMPLRWVYQQDNDPKHTSKKARTWFQEHGVEVMSWPAQSPDLNPIEHLWNDVKKAVHDGSPQNLQEVWELAQSAWKAIPIERCQKLIDSMPHRCAAVIKNIGGNTKY